MLGVRMLVALLPPLSADEAVATALSAVSAAVRPYGLRFAVPASLSDAFAPLTQAGDALGAGDILYYTGDWAGVASLLQDETHFLCLKGPQGFCHRWDAELYAAHRATGVRNALLTGCAHGPQRETPGFDADAPTLRRRPLELGKLRALARMRKEETRAFSALQPPDTPFSAIDLPAEAYLPAFVQDFQDAGVLVDRGLPLVCAAGPVRTLAVNPALFFGTTAFLHQAQLDLDMLSIAAYVAGFEVYALPRPVIWPLAPVLERLKKPGPDILGPSTLARFEQLAGLRYDKRMAGLKTTWGLFGAENTYAQRLPSGMGVTERFRAARMYLSERHMPLMCCAFVDMPHPSRPVMSYLLRFGFLRDIQSLPLLVYTGGTQERLLRSMHPNTRSYPAVVEGVPAGLKPRQHLGYAKPQLLLKAARAHVEFSHVSWLALDVLPHPICPEAVPDFSALMDDRIHLATVNGVPDTSFIVVPSQRLPLIAREAAAIAHLDVEAKRGLKETVLWERLFARFPDLFAIHRMPGRGLLFLTAFDPRLLSASLRARLVDLPAPHRPAAAPPKAAHPSNERSDSP